MTITLNQWKLFAVFLLIGLVVALGLRSSLGSADENQPPPEPEVSRGLLVDLRNSKCPIQGGAVDGSTYTEWNNLRVGFCCPGCDTQFLENPERVLDKSGIEWREAAEAIADYHASPAEHRRHKLAAIQRKWPVLRDPGGG
jgi:hypothetical protein